MAAKEWLIKNGYAITYFTDVMTNAMEAYAAAQVAEKQVQWREQTLLASSEIDRLRSEIKRMKAANERLREGIKKEIETGLVNGLGWSPQASICDRLQSLLSPNADAPEVPASCPNCSDGCEWCSSEVPAPVVETGNGKAVMAALEELRNELHEENG